MERNSSYIQEINSKERTMLIKIMKKYDLQVLDICRNRSVYKINTNKGYVCLKKIRHSKHKAMNGANLVTQLKEMDFNNSPNYISTNDGHLLVKYKRIYFYATEWVDGRECNIDNLNEVLESVRLLAKFHMKCKDVDASQLKIKNNLKKWPEDFNKNLYDLDKFKKLIQNKRLKSKFDMKYYEHADNFYSRGLIALNLLNSSKYYKLCSETTKHNTICHNSFYYQNIIKKDNEYYIIDLNSIVIDLQVMDLGKLIRRLMFKKNYRWDFDKAKLLIDAYNSVNKLTKDELEIMLSLIIFPHKFWKVGRKRYVRHKNWGESKYTHKLEKLIQYDELQQKFLQDYMVYLKNIKC